MNKKLSIIIVHYRKPPILRLCLKSIKKSLKDIDYEVIVADSASTEKSRDVLIEEFPDVSFIPFEENTGYSKGVNAALETSNGEYVFIANPDIVIFDDSINKMIKVLENDKTIGMVGPSLLNFNETSQPSCFRFYTPTTIACRRTFLGRMPYFKKILDNFLMSDKDLNKSQEVDWIMGSAMMTRREYIKKVGLMDERFFLYFEDVDWCKRFWDNGLKVIYYPEARMYHYHQRKSSKGLGILDLFLRKETRWHLTSGFKYFLKHGV